MYTISGHHHISMITKNAEDNNHFYKHILGLRRVKLTVNQDDPSMYHIFYGDKTGSPGTEMTFFEIPMAGNTYRGTNAITRIGLIVPSEASLSYWMDRLDQYEIEHGGNESYANRKAILFEDNDGLRLAITVGDSLPFWEVWVESAVPTDHQIQGMGAVEMTVRRPQKLASTLVDLFGYTKSAESEDEAIFQSVQGEQFGEIIVKYEEGDRERPGRGSVHHLAIRVKDDTELEYWDQEVRKRGFVSTGIVDRFYFKSLYFRESNGIMFEIATDGPGFTVDGPVETLGKQLDLPDFLEDRREEIEATLKPIKE